jgi:hypothetical protein
MGSERREPSFSATVVTDNPITRNFTEPSFHRWVKVSAGKAVRSDAISAVSSWIFSIFTTLCLAGFIFGWMALHGFVILALIVPILAVVIGIGTLTRYGAWNGECPHCSEEIWIAGNRHAQSAITCPICAKRVFLKNGNFRAV